MNNELICKEYEMLHGEIELQNNLLIFMVTATVTIITIAVKSKNLLLYLFPFYIIIPTMNRIAYYKKAIAEINKSIENPVFFFFSDDKKYVEETFDVPNKVIVTCNKGKRSFFDMYLMAHCKNMIVANSTFSWWAAYLNTRAEKIYCPIRWNNIKPYPNLILEGWHVVEP